MYCLFETGIPLQLALVSFRGLGREGREIEWERGRYSEQIATYIPYKINRTNNGKITKINTR